MGRTPSTTHRWHFCRALHLTPSDKKLGGCDPKCLCLFRLFQATAKAVGIMGTLGILGILGIRSCVIRVDVIVWLFCLAV